jgi:hypothetical protein
MHLSDSMLPLGGDQSSHGRRADLDSRSAGRGNLREVASTTPFSEISRRFEAKNRGKSEGSVYR